MLDDIVNDINNNGYDNNKNNISSNNDNNIKYNNYINDHDEPSNDSVDHIVNKPVHNDSIDDINNAYLADDNLDVDQIEKEEIDKTKGGVSNDDQVENITAEGLDDEGYNDGD